MTTNTHIGTLSALCFALLSLNAQAQTAPMPGAATTTTSDWTFMAGAAAASGPSYIGASKTKTLAIPTFDVRYRDWFFITPLRGIGVEVELLQGLKGSASVGASFDAREAKDDARLNGLGDIGMVPAINLGLDYAAGKAFVKGKLISRVGNSNERGTLFEVDAGYNVVASRSGVLGLGLQAKAMDNTYASNFFGVSAQQSAASGLPVFNASGGVASVGAFVQAIVPVSDRWTIFGRAAYSTLQNDAANGPITVERDQVFLVATLLYKF